MLKILFYTPAKLRLCEQKMHPIHYLKETILVKKTNKPFVINRFANPTVIFSYKTVIKKRNFVYKRYFHHHVAASFCQVVIYTKATATACIELPSDALP